MDITATLGLDNSDYLNKIKQADTSTKSFSTSAQSSFKNVETSLESAKSAVEGLNSKFEGLTKVLVGVGIVEFTKSLLESANQLKDMSNGLDISIARMMEMGAAAAESGGSLDKISAMMNKMEIAAGQAAEGNTKLRIAFQDVGLSMQDLQNLTPDQAFNKIALALSKIEAPAERARIATELFGKTFRGFSFEEYSRKIQETYGTMDKFGESQKKAAELNEKLNASLTLIKAAFLELISPILEVLKPTGDFSDQMERAQKVALLLGAAFAAFGLAGVISAFNTIVSSVKAVAEFFTLDTAAVAANSVALSLNTEQYKFRLAAIGSLGTAVKGELLAEANLNRALEEGTASTATITKLEEKLAEARARLNIATEVAAKTQNAYAASMAEVAAASEAASVGTGNAAKGIGATGLAATAANGPLYAFGLALGRLVAFVAPIALLVGAIEGINFAVEKSFGTGPVDYFANALESLIQDKFPALYNAINWVGDALGMAPSKIAKDTPADNKADKELEDQMAKLKKRQEEKAAADKQAADAAKLVSDHIKDVTVAYTAQAAAIGKTTEQMNWSNNRSLERIALQTQIVGLSKADQAAQLAAFDATTKYHNEIIAIDTAITALEAKRKEDPKVFAIEGGEAVIAAYNKQKAALKDITDQQAALTKQEVLRKEAAEMTTYFLNEQRKATETILGVQQEIEDLTLTTNETRLAGVDRLIEKEKTLAIQKRQDQLGEGQQVSDEEVQAISAKIDASYAGLKIKTQQLIDKSREFSTGWAKASKQYIEDAGDAAKQAEALFTKAFGGMEDAIVNFAKTGKFEWKGFVSSMLEELLRSQIKSVFANMLSGFSNSISGVGAQAQDQSASGGILSALGLGGSSGASGSSSGGLLSSLFGGGSTGANGTPVYITNWPGGTTGSGLSGLLGGSGTQTTGSSGGGLFDSISKMFGGSTKSTPNSGIYGPTEDGGNIYDPLGDFINNGYKSSSSSSGGFFSGIGDALSSVGNSVSDMFSGFFANGGSIPAGKFGIVGEAGKEIVSGPATVTPMDKAGGSTTVNYNIYANDALSFKQMIAADPTFLYAVTMLGAKGGRA